MRTHAKQHCDKVDETPPFVPIILSVSFHTFHCLFASITSMLVTLRLHTIPVLFVFSIVSLHLHPDFWFNQEPQVIQFINCELI